MAITYGRYETIGTIASGGMATVYLGRAVGEGGFERLVAIKVMHPHIASDPNFQAMFLDEARLAARIRHQNVVGVIDVQKAPEGMFLVMDYVDGRGLHELRRLFRKMRSTLPLGIALRIFIDALSGLHAAHELTDADGASLNLVHRDVSPHNILVGKDGVTRITDFGVARAEARLSTTRGAQLKGKIAYMAPEQIKNETLDCRADIYSAGCALWEALVGKRLFKADSDAALLHMILSGAEQGPRSFDDTIPEAVDRVCMRALSVDPRQRPATAADFADELEAAARVGGVDVATHRQVASFVKALPPVVSELQKQSPSSPSASTLQSDAAPVTASGVIVTGASAPGRDVTHGVAVLSMAPAPSRRPLWIGLALAGLGLLGMIAYLASSGTSPTTAAAGGADSTKLAAAAPTSPATPEILASATASATAAASASAAPAASSTSEPKAPTPSTAKPLTPAVPRPTRPAGPGYNPTEL